MNEQKNIFNGIGDHKHAQIVSFETDAVDKFDKIFTRTFPTSKIPLFLETLQQTDFSPVYAVGEVDEKLTVFYNLFLASFNHYFPHKVIKHGSQNHKPWITKGISISSARKRILFDHCKYSSDPAVHEHYKQYSKILQNIVRAAKRKYTVQRIQNAPKNKKSRVVWDVIKEFSKKK